MASKALASSALLLALNLLFFTMASSTNTPASKGTCPMDALKLGVCANILGVKLQVGSPPTLPCCTLIDGLADLEVAACLCTAIKANVLGINLNVPIDLSILLNNCGKYSSDKGFKCS
ncbi:hypothetical protein L6164_036046 [Bauhinia variegata]|uniref:Uncharacterized protein n=1 Tax=Bauhinia variegata TaxID=167791 RepID=A0ACB9KFU9_BAUVA|nr:hypothetical protein L6164_036046 [Bauhinia variegata]